jgi:hypothetical protein
MNEKEDAVAEMAASALEYAAAVWLECSLHA